MTKTGYIAIGALIGFAGGGFLGFLGGLAATRAGRSFIAEMATSEEQADVKRPREVARAGFRLRHPGNWKVDTEDEDYDADHLFSIGSPGSSMVTFIVYDGVMEPEIAVKAQVDQMTAKLIKNPTQTSFSRWGSYEGRGVVLRGAVLGITRGSVRVFSHAAKSRSFTIVEHTYDEDRAQVEAGFRLIEGSFRLVE